VNFVAKLAIGLEPIDVRRFSESVGESADARCAIETLR
jgi:hypothetical protein